MEYEKNVESKGEDKLESLDIFRSHRNLLNLACICGHGVFESKVFH